MRKRILEIGVMLSLRSIWREAYVRRAGVHAARARSFGTEVPQDDAGSADIF